ncbi:hypothetical protein C8R46DRAFT_886978, partial [Mycena filopes]
PDGAPSWLRESITNLAATSLGPSFKPVLEAVIRVEEAHKFKPVNGKKMNSTGRPDVVSVWVKGGRGSKFANYPAVWQGWWDSLQPSWRKRDARGRWEIGGEYGTDWTTLDHPGANGVLNLAASLYFWGRQAQEMRAKEGEEWFSSQWQKWEAAVHDVTWMLDGLDTDLSS